MRGRWLWIAPAALVGMAAFIALGGWLVMMLWNWLTPPLFGWHAITFWQAVGLLGLARILFGGLGLHNSARHNMGWRMRRRMSRMTAEEKDQFRRRMRERWGFGAPAGGGPMC